MTRSSILVMITTLAVCWGCSNKAEKARERAAKARAEAREARQKAREERRRARDEERKRFREKIAEKRAEGEKKMTELRLRRAERLAARSAGGMDDPLDPLAGGAKARKSPLSQKVVNAVFRKKRRQLVKCMRAEKIKSLTIHLMVRTSGRLLTARVTPTEATGCVRKAIYKVRFPPFKGNVAQARYVLKI